MVRIIYVLVIKFIKKKEINKRFFFFFFFVRGLSFGGPWFEPSGIS